MKTVLFIISLFAILSACTETTITPHTDTNISTAIDTNMNTAVTEKAAPTTATGDNNTIEIFLANYKKAVAAKDIAQLMRLSNAENVREDFYDTYFFEFMSETIANANLESLSEEEGYFVLQKIEGNDDMGSGLILYIKQNEDGNFTIDRALAVG